MTEKKRTAIDRAFAALLSDDDAKALDALAVIHEKGDAGTILPLLHALAQTDSPARQQRIEAMLYAVKVSAAAPQLARALDVPELLDVRKVAIAAFWNAGLDAGPWTERLVQIAVEGDAHEALEVLSVLEHQELLPEGQARAALRRVKGAVARGGEDSYKQALLGELENHLQERLGAG